MISMDKKYRTRDGREVRIYAVDGLEAITVHGAIKLDEGWELIGWRSDGRLGGYAESDCDLIEVRPRIQREVWVNVYAEGASDAVGATAYYTKEYADRNAFKNRIACVRLTIDCEEGHGLD